MLVLAFLLGTATLRQEVTEALRQKDYTKAESLVLAHLRLATDPVPLHAILGGVYFQSQRYAESVEQFRKAEPLDPSNRFTLAMALVTLGEHREARKELERLPESAINVYWLGRLDFLGGDYAGAILKFKRVIEREPGSARALDNLGLSYEAIGELDQAETQYRRAIKADARAAQWPNHNLGALLLKKGRVDEAAGALQAALGADQNFAPAHFQMGKLLEARQQDSAAIEAFRKAIAADPKHAQAHYALYRLYQKSGNPAAAQRHFELFRSLQQPSAEGPRP